MDLAYIDPFSGSIVLQLIIGGAIGGLACCRKWLGRLLRLICGQSKSEEA